MYSRQSTEIIEVNALFFYVANLKLSCTEAYTLHCVSKKTPTLLIVTFNSNSPDRFKFRAVGTTDPER